MAFAPMLLFVLLLHFFRVKHCGLPRGPTALSVFAVHWVVVEPKLAEVLLLLLVHILHLFLAEHRGTPTGPRTLPVFAVHMAVTAVGVLLPPA